MGPGSVGSSPSGDFASDTDMSSADYFLNLPQPDYVTAEESKQVLTYSQPSPPPTYHPDTGLVLFDPLLSCSALFLHARTGERRGFKHNKGLMIAQKTPIYND